MCEKERLLDELADFLDSVTEENFDVERLDALLNAAVERFGNGKEVFYRPDDKYLPM